MKKTLSQYAMILALGFALALTLAGCTSAQMGSLAEAGALAAGMDSEEAKKYGAATRSAAEALLPVPYEQERAIGGGVAIKAFEVFGAYYDDPALQRYVALVGKAVAAKSSRPDLPYAFAVLDNDTPNAFAGPGGYVFITVGALKNMHSEAQLAGVLAHEVGHICHRHALTTLRRSKILESASQWAAIADEANAAQYAELMTAVEDTLFTHGLDQKMEFQADQRGVDYAVAAGYNPWGEREYLSNLEALLPSGVSGGWFSTHPPLRDRIQRLDVYLNENYPDYRGLPDARARFRREVTARLEAKGR